MKGLDLSKFKKVSSDENKTVFKHADGHFLHVQHKNVKPEQKKALTKLPTQKLAEGGEVDPAEQVKDKFSSIGNFISNNVIGQPLGPQGVPMDRDSQEQMPSVAPAAETTPPTLEVGQAPAPQAQEAQGPLSPSQVLPSQRGISEMEAGIGQQQKAEQMQAQDRQVAAQKHQQDLTDLMANHDKRYAELTNEKANIIHDMHNGHIDPDHYFETLSTPGKVTTAIGLLLGGLGGAASGGHNYAMDFLQKQIDRDVDAQKANLNHKSSLLSAINGQVGDLEASTTLAKSVQTDFYASKLEEAAAKAADPMAKARALDAAGKLHMQSDLMVQRANMMMSFQKAAQGGHNVVASAINWLPEADQKQAREELGHIQAVDHSIQSVRDTFDKLKKMKTVFGKVNPTQAAEIRALEGTIVSLAPEIFNKTSDTEIHILQDKFIPGVLSGAISFDKASDQLTKLLEGKRQAPTLEGYRLMPTSPAKFNKR